MKLIFDVRPLTTPGNYAFFSPKYSTINPHNSSYTLQPELINLFLIIVISVKTHMCATFLPRSCRVEYKSTEIEWLYVHCLCLRISGKPDF